MIQFDIDKEIEACKKKKRPSEEIVFAIGAGRIVPKPGMIKKQEEALKYISKLDGFIGVHPVDLWHTLLIFDTLNNAKRAYNDMKVKGIPQGNIVPILVEKKFLRNKQ